MKTKSRGVIVGALVLSIVLFAQIPLQAYHSKLKTNPMLTNNTGIVRAESEAMPVQGGEGDTDVELLNIIESEPIDAVQNQDQSPLIDFVEETKVEPSQVDYVISSESEISTVQVESEISVPTVDELLPTTSDSTQETLSSQEMGEETVPDDVEDGGEVSIEEDLFQLIHEPENFALRSNVANVANSNEYITAITDPGIDLIVLGNDITITSAIPNIVARNLVIDGDGHTLNYGNFGVVINDNPANNGEPADLDDSLKLKMVLQNVIFHFTPGGAILYPHRFLDTNGIFVVRNVDFTGVYLGYAPVSRLIFEGKVDATQAANGAVAYSPDISFASGLEMKTTSSEFIHFNEGLFNGPHKAVFESGSKVTVTTRNAFVHTESLSTKIILKDNAVLNATLGTYFNQNDSLHEITVGAHAIFNVSTAYTGSTRILEFQQRIDIAEDGLFSLKSTGTSKLVRASRANSTVTLGNNSTMVLENKGTVLMELTSPGHFIFPGQKVETWDIGSNFVGTATKTWEHAKGDVTFAGTIVAVDSPDADFNAAFKPNAYGKLILSKKAPPVLSTTLSTKTYERTTSVTEATFLSDVGASLDLPGSLSSNFVAVVNLNVPGDYVVTINGTDIYSHTSNPKTVTVTVEDTTAPILTVDPTVIANGITYERGSVVSEASFLTDAQVSANEPVTYSSDYLTQVDLNALGSYTVTITGTDPSGNASTVQVVVHVTDTTNPTLTVDSTIVANGVTYERGSTVLEATFISDAQVTASEPVTFTSNFASIVDLDVVGDYTVTITGTDPSDNAGTAQVVVHVTDTVNPILTVNPTIVANGVTYERGSTVLEATFISDAQVTANEPVTFTSDFTSVVDLDVVGNYTVTITGTDPSGNVGTAQVVVHVTDTTNPTLTVDPTIVANGVTYERGSTVLEATFIIDAQVTANEPVTFTSDFASVVDLDVVGNYTVTITGTDGGNNAVTVQVVVHVTDTVDPILTVDPTIVANGVTYERGSTVLETTFISDAQVTTNEPVTFTSDFTSVVDLDVVGNYTVTITGTDGGNNSSTVQVVVHVKDTTPATLTLPPDIMANGVVYDVTSTVTESEFIVDSKVSASEIVTYSSNFSSQVNLNVVGIYSVTITAKDAFNNISTITVKVVVRSKRLIIDPDIGTKGVIYERGSSVTPNQFLLDASISASNPAISTFTSDFAQVVNLNRIGRYVVTIAGSNTYASTVVGTATVDVFVRDTTPPVVTVKTVVIANGMEYLLNSQVTPEQFILDVQAGANETVTLSSDFSSVVKLNQAGEYKVTIVGTDEAGNVGNIVVSVFVKENVNPIIVVDPTIEKDGVIYERGIAVTAEQFIIDAKISANTKVSFSSNFTSVVNLNQIGTYEVEVVAKDAQDKQVTVKIKVIVRDTIPPVISARDSQSYPKNKTVSVEQFYSDIAVSLNEEGSWLSDFSSVVNSKFPNTYTVTITATDKANNVSTKTINVLVTQGSGITTGIGSGSGVGKTGEQSSMLILLAGGLLLGGGIVLVIIRRKKQKEAAQ